VNDYDVIFGRLGSLVLDEGGTAVVALEPSADELAEIDLIRAISAEIQEPAPITYTAARTESADLTVHFRHVVE